MKLLLTLGHNASAILIDKGVIVAGYEEERLSYVKSDKHFPVLAINQLLRLFPSARSRVTAIYISHWFWDFELKNSIFLDLRFLSVNFREARIHSLHESLTHHDAHAMSVWNFCDGAYSGLTIVADGFGSNGECLSLYQDGELSHRSFSTEWSLGLMYQYATSFLGMHENRDEYKLLGYEQLSLRKFDVDMATRVSDQQIAALNQVGEPKEACDMRAVLQKAREHWYRIFSRARCDRVELSQFVQFLLERAVLSFADGAHKLKVSGGVFYNVKLNNALIRLDSVDSFEANPLSGDQGCALGMVDVRYDHVFWGPRDVTYCQDLAHWSEVMAGPMEFGPRALGNTSTIASPTLENVARINKLNKRSAVMPMAPIVTEEFARKYFADYGKLGKCKHFMVASLDYIEPRHEWLGAAHIDNERGVYTGRLQVMDEHTNPDIVGRVNGIAINTSLNAHGQPILWDKASLNLMRRIQSD